MDHTVRDVWMGESCFYSDLLWGTERTIFLKVCHLLRGTNNGLGSIIGGHYEPFQNNWIRRLKT